MNIKLICRWLEPILRRIVYENSDLRVKYGEIEAICQLLKDAYFPSHPHHFCLTGIFFFWAILHKIRQGNGRCLSALQFWWQLPGVRVWIALDLAEKMGFTWIYWLHGATVGLMLIFVSQRSRAQNNSVITFPKHHFLESELHLKKNVSIGPGKQKHPNIAALWISHFQIRWGKLLAILHAWRCHKSTFFPHVQVVLVIAAVMYFNSSKKDENSSAQQRLFSIFVGEVTLRFLRGTTGNLSNA